MKGNHQVFVGRDYGQTKAYSEQVAFEIDQEVRKILMEAHQKAHEIIEAHRAQHKLIAENFRIRNIGCESNQIFI